MLLYIAEYLAFIMNKLRSLLLCFLILSVFSAFGQSPDLDYSQESDDTFFTAGLFTMTIFFLLIFCLLVILGICVALVIMAIIFALAFAGILSTSVVFGLYKKSFDKGFKIFSILGFAFCGSFFCAILFPVISKIFHWTLFEIALLYGATIGLLSGAFVGFLAYKLFKILAKKFMKAINSNFDEIAAERI